MHIVRRMKFALVLGMAALLAAAAPAAAWAPPASRDATASTAVLDKSSAIVVFKALPLATYDGRVPGYAKTRVSSGKLNPNSAAARKYLGYLKAGHDAFAKWLRTNVPSAKITSQYYTTLNAVAVKLNGNAIGKLRNNTSVAVVEYNALYRPDMSESYKLIGAASAWANAGGREDAGQGIKVGIIDSGIDVDHPFFDPAGFSYPTGFPKCDAVDTTAGACDNVSPKVIVARVFYNRLNNSGWTADPLPVFGEHGTHVAGTVAGVTGQTASVEGVEIDDLSGVAPAAWLGNYNVFPGELESARSEDILNAVEAAVLDGMDVLNLSLGGGYRGNNDLLAKGLDTAVAAGLTVVTSAGNEGPGGFTVGSPGRARNIITVGSSANQHFVGQPISFGASVLARGAVGDFDALPAGSFDVFDAASDGCASVPAGAAGKLVLIDRGVCTFSQKVANAKAAGAVAVIVINNVAGDPTAMARTLGFDDDIPAVMISKTDGAALRASGATSVTVAAEFSEFITDAGDILAGSSSQGPTFVDYAIKPDLTSVGVNVLSSVVCNDGDPCGNDGDWAFFSGTSMASPHVAGSAAVLKSLHPTWTPAMIKSALVNTADPVVKNAFDASTTVGPMQQGAGREDLGEADATSVAFSPVSASFGRITASRTLATSMTITLRNLTGADQTLAVSELRWNPAAGALGSVWGGGATADGDARITTPTSVTVPANGTQKLTITVRAGLANGTIVQGWLHLAGGGAEYQLAYWAQIAP
jgi:subtilisin family serine protease